MLTELRTQNFKSWADTGPMRLAPITGLFGANSSGKTSILQFLLMLKQTAESTDRSRVLNLGDERSLVNLGAFSDVIHQHQSQRALSFILGWRLPSNFNVEISGAYFNLVKFDAVIREFSLANDLPPEITLEKFAYHLDGMTFGLEYEPTASGFWEAPSYIPKIIGYELKEQKKGGLTRISGPVRFYGFPRHIYSQYADAGFLADLALQLENLFSRTFYLGPLREYPQRIYRWSGDRPLDVGGHGELAVYALVASQSEDVLERVAYWLKKLGMIHDFSLRPIGPNRKEYEIKIRRTAKSPEVLITDVGFGVSQVLPVLTLCYYVPQGSVVILEQPEVHLHPSVQSALADVFIDVVKTRKIQIILESHSEHLLRRLQRRIAEEEIAVDQTALYFCEIVDGASQLISLQLDEYGNISNWPADFFGDEMGDLTAMTVAAMERQNAQT